jgi:hypothetical protein
MVYHRCTSKKTFCADFKNCCIQAAADHVGANQMFFIKREIVFLTIHSISLQKIQFWNCGSFQF